MPLNSRNSKFVYSFTILVALAFIVLSVLLINRSNHVRSQIEEGVIYIGDISAADRDATQVQDTLFTASNQTLDSLRDVLCNHHQSLSNLDNSENLVKFLSLIENKNVDSDQQRKAILQEVSNFKEEAHNLINEKRGELGEFSEQLTLFWMYNYILIIVACFLSIVVIFIVFYALKNKRIANSQRFKNKQVIKNSVDGIIVCDEKGIITEINRNAYEMLAYSKEELLGKHIEIVYAFEKDLTMVFKEMEEKGSFYGVVTNKTKNGDLKKVQISANILKDDHGNVVGTMGISRDVTEQLRKEENIQYIIDNASDIIYTSTFDGTLTYVNETFEATLEFTKEELIGENFTIVIAPEWRESVIEFYKEHFTKKLTESYFEFKLQTKSGRKFWVGQHVQTRFENLHGERIQSFFGIVRDIDDRKNAELKLAESENRYRELFDFSGDLIHSIDTQGNFNYVNQSWRNALGYTEDEVEKMNLFEIIHPDSMQHCQNLFQEIMEHGQCPSGKVTYQLIKKNGEFILVEGTVSISVDGNNQVNSIQTFLRDITVEREAQEKLAKSEQSLRQITETINDVFYLYNIKENKYDYISPNCEAVLGADQDFFYAGKSHTGTFGHPDDVAILKNAHQRVDAGHAYEIEYRIIVDNSTRWINEKSFPIRDQDGNVVSNSGICRDVTDIKLAQKTIEIQNKEIQESINYAQNIQNSVLPKKSEVEVLFEDSFVIYLPKDVLSGDFYVADSLKTNDGKELKAFIVGDCTGHGVPGGVLSLLCNGLIKETFTNHIINSPAAALDYVRIKLVKLFRSDSNSHINDGMDITFCIVDEENDKLIFASANRSVIRLRDGEIEEFTGDRQHVGFNEDPQPFTNHSLDTQPGDLYIIYTDGYVDQFGGPRGKKFMRKNLHRLLKENQSLPMEKIGEILTQELKSWQNDTEQTDDITVFGVRI